MPIVGGYTIHLYCDGVNDEHRWNEFPHEYLHEELGCTARKYARKDGWYLGKKVTLCPRCNPKSKRYTLSEVGKSK